MLVPPTKKMSDHSKESAFSFSFFCDICGKEWRSKHLSFSGNDEIGAFEKINQLIWQCEHDAAYERAVHEVMLEFNHCPKCGKWVCQDCFHVRSHDLTDFCIECLPLDDTR